MSTTYRARDLYRRTCAAAAAMSHVIFLFSLIQKGENKNNQPTTRNSFCFFCCKLQSFARVFIETCDIFHFQHMGGGEFFPYSFLESLQS